jgi:pilus assembly protein CpaB
VKKEQDKPQGISRTVAFTIAAILGFLAFIMFQASIRNRTRSLEKTLGEKIQVIVAVEDVPPGQPITHRQIDEQNIYGVARQAGAITNKADVIDRISLVPIAAGQQILEGMLQDTGGYLSLRIGRGLGEKDRAPRRAISLNLDGEGMLAGLVRPGDRVDIIGIFESESPEGLDAQPKNHAMVLVQNVEVLAVDADLSEFSPDVPGSGPDAMSGLSGGRRSGSRRGGGDQALVTFDVSADEAWRLSLAARIAHLRCVLRHKGSMEVHDYRETEFDLPSIDSKRQFRAGGVPVNMIRQSDQEHY